MMQNNGLKKGFKDIFLHECRRLLNWKYLSLLFLFILILFLFIQDGHSRYQIILKNKDTFKQTEMDKVSQYVFITQYGSAGFRLMFIPSPLCIFSNSYSIADGLMSNIDTTEKLNIYIISKSGVLFKEKGIGFIDFSGVIILIGCLLVILYGYQSTKASEYLKFLSSFINHKKLFIYLVISRLILVNIVFFLLSTFSFIFLPADSFDILGFFLLGFVLILLLVVSFTWLAGALIGTIESKSISIITLVGVYFLFMFFSPWTVSKISNVNASNLLQYNFELESDNQKKMMNFEKRALDKVGIYEDGEPVSDEVKELIRKVIVEEYEEFKISENILKDQLSGKIKIYQKIASFFPHPFFISIVREVGSEGFVNFMIFYRHSHVLKYKFINFYVDEKFIKEVKPGNIEPFLKNGDEYLFFAKNQLPGSFTQGILITSFYIILLFIALYQVLDKKIKGKPGELRGLDIDLKSGRLNFLLTGDPGINNQVYNFLSGKGKSFVKIFIDGEEIKPGDEPFVYLFDTKMMPGDVSPRSLYKLVFNSKIDRPMKRWDILFKWASQTGKIIVMDKFMDQLKEDDINKIKEVIHSEKLIVLYISDKYYKGVHLITDEYIIEHPKDKTVDKPKKRP